MDETKINYNHRYYYENGHITGCFGDNMDSVDEYAEEMDALIQELKKMRQALHDAINRPMGIVPESAERFYDQSYYDLPNNQK